MSKFIDSLCLTEISDSVFEVAYHTFRYQSDLGGRTFTVPIGFYTDFASVPRFMPFVYACLGDTAHEPAVIHDWLYYSALTDRPTADAIFLEAMKAWGMSPWRYNPIYWGVRMGGWSAWNQHRKDGHPEAGKFAESPDILSKKIQGD
jgi:Protein of unknown function (DUF1353)